MKVAIRDPDALRAVRPLDLAGYLRANGWAKASDLDGRAALWTLDDEEILAPFASEVADYHRRVGEAIAVLAHVEHRSEAAVWRDIASVGFDVVRVRAGRKTGRRVRAPSRSLREIHHGGTEARSREKKSGGEGNGAGREGDRRGEAGREARCFLKNS